MSGTRIQLDKSVLAAFCRENSIQRLSLFGSILRKDFGPDSDIDVLVEFIPGHTPSLMGMARLEAELTAMLGRNVDLRTAAELHHRFRDRIVRDSEVQYAA